MSSGREPDQRGPVLFLILLLLVGLLVVAWGAAHPSAVGRASATAGSSPTPTPPAPPAPSAVATPSAARAGAIATPQRPGPTPGRLPSLPGGGARVFAGNRFLVAYYGTARTGALGVLGETDPDTMDHRLHHAAAAYRRPGQPMRYVYELIVTVADGRPGPRHDYSHDIARAEVRRYVRAAHRNGALLLLDLQPGRSDFLTTARRWEWALRDPWVGLALDPEWRMAPHQVPAHTVGQVDAREVNRTAAWLARLTRREALPQKLFVLHQFRVDMVHHIQRIGSWPQLATVQHVDGFGTPGEKLATYRRVARPGQFVMGFKLFYDEDVRRMGAAQVHRIRPRVRFVSYQ